MKKSGLLILSSVLVLGGLTSLASCGNGDDTEEVTKGTITISGNLSCEVGGSSQLSATVTNDDTREGVTWSSSDTSIATIDSTGKVSGIKEGTVTITCTMIADPSVSQEVTFTVNPSSDPSVEIVAPTTSLTVGSSFTLEAEVYNPKGQALTFNWESQNNISTISGNSETITVNPVREGSEVIKLTLTIGQVQLVSSVSLYYQDDFTSYTEIATKEDFDTIILGDADKTLDEKYCLTADIDLEGEKINGANLALSLTGTFDGRGYTLSNYEIVGNVDGDGYYPNTALFKSITASGSFRNTHLSAYTNQEGIGWGSSILVNELGGTVSNCLIEYENKYNQGKEGWFPFNAAIAGTLQANATIRDCVIDVTGDGQGGVMAIAAYPAGGVKENGQMGDTQNFTVNGIYTNQTSAATYGSAWEWGGPITIAKNVVTDIVWDSAEAITYSTLNSTLWNLVDNTMPSLKNI